jgi:hypothetical protein
VLAGCFTLGTDRGMPARRRRRQRLRHRPSHHRGRLGRGSRTDRQDNGSCRNESAVSRAAGFSFSTTVLEGEPGSSLVRESKGAALLVVGPPGARWRVSSRARLREPLRVDARSLSRRRRTRGLTRLRVEVAYRIDRRLGSAADAHLGKHAGHVVLHRLLGQMEVLPDGPVGETLGHQLEYPTLLIGE